MHRDQYCTLIVLWIQYLHAVYFDSGRAKPKKYTNIKNVLDDALNCYYLKGNGLKIKVVIKGKRVFDHETEFPCVKQPKDSTMEAFYAIHHMREFVWDHRLLVEPYSLTTWVRDFANYSEEHFRLDLYHIQHKLGQLIWKDVCSSEGLFYFGPIKLSQWQIEEICHLQGDHWDFMTIDGLRPFPHAC
jgi:hypothetical protein